MMKTLTLLASMGAAVATKCGKKDSSKYTPITRTYCIGLVDGDWDYGVASTEYVNDLTGRFEDMAEYQLNEDKPKLGQYAKRGFLKNYYIQSDGTCMWSAPIDHDNTQRDGILGPTIRGVVGDTIVVNFRNYATYVYVDSVEVDNGDDDEFLMINATFNLAPTGLHADHKAAIGYEGVEQYTWTVGKNANTGLSSTTVWTYKSDAIESGNEKNQFEFGYDSGVFGPIVVVDPSYIMNNDQKRDAFPCDIDEEVNLAFMETSESNSVYYKWNLHDFFDKKYHDKYREEAEFAIPNTKRSINGHMYGNLGASTGMEFDYGTKVRFNVIVQNTTMNWIPKEDEHEHEDAYMWGPSQGWTNITVNMGHEMGGSMVHNFDGKSTQTLDYQCLTEGTVLIDVDFFNMYGVSSYFTTLEDDGTFVREQQSSGGSKTSSAGEAVGIVFACIFCFFLGGLVVYAREIILKTETYAKCMDDSTSEVVELNGEGVKSNDV